MLTEKADFSELLFLQRLYVPGCLAGSLRLLPITVEHFFYLILHCFQLQGVFGSPEPENPLKTNVVLERARGKEFVVLPKTSDITDSRKNKRF